ncbi:MAG: ribose-phosphate diphosphokinase [Proteobacteria bacterium]|nr:ribose-phosphate diphosphokinase [Pseudomonadota bacterium]
MKSLKVNFSFIVFAFSFFISPAQNLSANNDSPAKESCQSPLTQDTTITFTDSLRKNPVEIYEELRERALEARARGETSFKFEEMRPTVYEILSKISGYLISKEKAHKESRSFYEDLQKSGEQILSTGIMYHDFIRWSMRFIEQVDQDYRKIHPHFTSYYHQNLAKNVVEDLLSKWPDVLAFPSFQSVGLDYFFDTRVVPVHLIGFTTESIFGDGFDLTPAEFAYHDWGHIEFLSLRDIDHLTDPYAKISSTLREWLENRDNILTPLRELRTSDPDLFRGVQMTFFEVLHERGYPYDLFRLKAQFETTKWTEILHRKLTNNFWKNLVFTDKQLERLDEARLWLLRLTQDLIEKRNLENIKNFKGYETPLRIRYSPPVETLTGTFTGAHFTEEGKIIVDFKSKDGSQKSCGIFDVSLAQISNEGSPNYSHDEIQLLEKLLWVQWKGARIEINGNPKSYRLLNIGIDEKGLIKLTLKDELGELQKVLLKDVKIPYEVTTNEFVIKDVEVYKIRQLLALHSSGKDATFIVQDAQEFFEGTVANIQKDSTGLSMAVINKLGRANESITRPLSDLHFSEDGPILFTVKSNEPNAERRAREQNLLFSHAKATQFPTSNILWRLERDVRFRDTSVIIPNRLTPDSFMEALIAVRTLKTNGAGTVNVTTNNYSMDLHVEGVNFHFDPLTLFRVAGAQNFRIQNNELRRLPKAPGNSHEAISAKTYLMDLRGDQLVHEISSITQIPVWEDPQLIPLHSQIYLLMDGGMNVNLQLLKALSLIDRLKEQGNRVTLVTPYLPFARSDKVDEAGGITITGRLGADLLESVGMDSVIFMRAHAPQSQGFFSVPSEQLSSRPTLIPYLRKIGVEKIIAPDEGAQKAASLYAGELGVGISTANKQRDSLTQKIKIFGLSDMQVQNLTVAIVDDELETGGTGSQVVDLLKALGAKKIYVLATHLTGDASKVLTNPNVDGIICTNSVNNKASQNPKFLVLSAAQELSNRIILLERARRMSR